MRDEGKPRDTDATVEDRADPGDSPTFEDLAFRQAGDRSAEAREEQASDRGTAAIAVGAPEPEDETKQAEPAEADKGEQTTPLFDEEATGTYRQRWQDVQSRFVDDPRKAVTEADVLVADLMQTLAKTFADERARLEETWTQGGNASTEELRIALQRYRSFFGRLLSV